MESILNSQYYISTGITWIAVTTLQEVFASLNVTKNIISILMLPFGVMAVQLWGYLFDIILLIVSNIICTHLIHQLFHLKLNIWRLYLAYQKRKSSLLH